MLTLRKNNKLSDKKLREFLYTLNFKIYSDSTQYLIDAIHIAYEKPNLLNSMKDIYTIISIKYSISENTVKWSIRNAIETMNRNTDSSEINRKLQITGYKTMTPKVFIPLVILHFKEL